jgi:molybdopterin/thiamine biosynthesis adenylyltransferase
MTLECFCRENSIPLVHGGIDGFYGVAYLYVPSYSLTPSEAGLCEGNKAKFNISSVVGVIGSYQASLGIQYLLTNDSSLGGRILIFDENKTDTLNLNF